MQTSYPDILSSITNHLTAEEKKGLPALEKQLVNGYLNLGKEISPANRANLRFVESAKPENKASEEEIAAALKGKNCTVMFGAGKDSSFVLTIARALQLQLLEKYGETFELRAGIGRHPGMIDCLKTVDDQGRELDGNIERVLKALDMHDDPRTDVFFIDNKRTVPYSDAPIPDDVIEQNRSDVLINAHIWGGAGRRSFCDDCNKNLSRWIATALGHNGGADLYMTGDSRTELNTQVGTDIPNMMEALGLDSTPPEMALSPTQEAFRKLNAVGERHTQLTHGDTPEAVDSRHIPYEDVPERTRLVSVFDQIKYDSNKRMGFFHDFLKFDFDSLMFSFTETDCGNPALMAHNIGLIAEATGSTYVDGIRAYVDYAIGKMEEKGFAGELIDKMRERYRDDEAIEHMRARVEDYACRAYRLEPQHLEAMVYAPFTQGGKNLEAWLKHLDERQESKGDVLRYTGGLFEHKEDIRELMEHPAYLASPEQTSLIEEIEHQTGLSMKQMRHLWKAPLMMNNLTQPGKGNLDPERFDEESDRPDLQALVRRQLGIISANDTMYHGTVKFAHGEERQVMGR